MTEVPPGPAARPAGRAGESPALVTPDPATPLLPPIEPDDRSGYLHRLFIGTLGFLLPLLLWTIAAFRPIDRAARWRLLDSISAYYYSGAVAVFVGTLAALTVFFYTYRGYDNASGWRDRLAASVAGTAAFLVALFPTSAATPAAAPPWWTTGTGVIHYGAAVVLFASFAFFALVLFPMSKVEPGETLPDDKKWRNRIYRTCGVAMLACIGWALVAHAAGAPIFWPESLALEAFAVSWLVKGRADVSIVRLARRLAGGGT
ncbi:MAG: hypothetical protein R2752_15135 [Vicinamibacterales bacterium]